MARIAYMPLATYPEAVEDRRIEAAVTFATSLECMLHVTAFAVDIPGASSGLGDFLINIPGLVHAAEERSKAECHRLHGVVNQAAESRIEVSCTTRKVALGAVADAAAAEARYFDLTLLPWSGEDAEAQDMTQSIVFGSGRPSIIVPSSATPAPLDHIAIAWDASRVAARALGDALPLLAEGGRVSVLTVQDEKPLGGSDLASALASSLQQRGFSASSVNITLGKGSISEILQESALLHGARLLAMGGFGHSRVRDFILGGATKGVLTQLQLPVLLSH